MDVKCPKALAALVKKVKASFCFTKKRQFCETDEYQLMTQEKLEKGLDLNEAEVYFFLRCASNTTSILNLSKWRTNLEKSSNYLPC